MSIWSRIRSWLRRLKPQSDSEILTGPLREFTYLDEVSVYSLLASRKDGIATEFIESQTDSLQSDYGREVGLGFGWAQATSDSRTQTGHVQGSQVLRKAIIQTTFKELHDNERDSLALSPPDPKSLPVVKAFADIEKLDQNENNGWIVAPSAISRGDLLEVEVELETDLVFGVASGIATVSGLMEDIDQQFVQAMSSQLAQMKSIAHLLDGLLFGLVPIRGRLVDYTSANIGGRDVLIHRSLSEQIDPGTEAETFPVFIVGVAQRDLFWKDFRRVLFSKARYTVFCRLETEGLADTWHPFKVAEMLSGIDPQFDESFRSFSGRADLAKATSSDRPPSPEGQRGHDNGQVIAEYAALLAASHCQTLAPEFIENLLQDTSLGKNWLDSVESRRPIFFEVTRRVDTELGVNTCSDIAYDLRHAVLNKAGMRGDLAPQESSGNGRDQKQTLSLERFLEAEIIAIYW